MKLSVQPRGKRYLSSMASAALLLGVLGTAPVASADTIFVGYADGLRGAGFFPSIWDGSPNTLFVGTTPGFDAGAIRVDNTTGASQIISVSVSAPWSGVFNLDLWGPQVVLPGQRLVLTETAHYNFDTSDWAALVSPGSPLADGDPTGAAEVKVTINGVTTSFFDTGHILNTGGFDLAALGVNESQEWRPIGTTGITNPGGNPNPNPVPEASTSMVGFAALGMIATGIFRSRRSAKHAA